MQKSAISTTHKFKSKKTDYKKCSGFLRMPLFIPEVKTLKHFQNIENKIKQYIRKRYNTHKDIIDIVISG
jgi:hypothetical protein